MTSGSYSSGGGYPTLLASRIKVWNGSNAKYEIVNGKKRVKFNNYDVFYQEESAQRGGSPAVTGTSGPSAAWTASDEVALQSKLVAKVKRHEFNLAVNVAQSKELVNMVSHNLRNISRSLRALKHGDFSSATRFLLSTSSSKPKKPPPKLVPKDISGRWLELQYGWLPALGDTYEAFKAYHTATDYRIERLTVGHKGSRIPFEGSPSPTFYTFPGFLRARKYVIYEMSEALSAPRSLGLLDPLSVAWEILPYSFVIDWFIPIGSYLENLSVIPTLRGRFCNTVVLTKDSSYAGSLPAGFPTYAGKGRSAHRKQTIRTVTTGLSTAFPGFNQPFAKLMSRRVGNAIALAYQRLAH